jgi:hypothetical protein
MTMEASKQTTNKPQDPFWKDARYYGDDRIKFKYIDSQTNNSINTVEGKRTFFKDQILDQARHLASLDTPGKIYPAGIKGAQEKLGNMTTRLTDKYNSIVAEAGNKDSGDSISTLDQFGLEYLEGLDEMGVGDISIKEYLILMRMVMNEIDDEDIRMGDYPENYGTDDEIDKKGMVKTRFEAGMKKMGLDEDEDPEQALDVLQNKLLPMYIDLKIRRGDDFILKNSYGELGVADAVDVLEEKIAELVVKLQVVVDTSSKSQPEVIEVEDKKIERKPLFNQKSRSTNRSS